ncbi:MAG: YggS family pyridoxal phosphate-dependent enzyme [Bacteroidales bacterium]|nr:YggS family pyridoxal phosphate-dependent enzyme [Bacteroidales bacterium]
MDANNIANNINSIISELPAGVVLLAVSKYKPAGDILEAYGCGQRRFAENRPQELAAKAEDLPKDIEWHFIGHLQTNKIKMVVPYAAMIHSIDSVSLLEAVSKAAQKAGRKVKCLLELHVAKEQTKHGFTADELRTVAREAAGGAYEGVEIAGVMTMATNTTDADQIRSEFRQAKALADELGLPEISMGMSGDWKIAVEEGATMVRIGSAIFGGR